MTLKAQIHSMKLFLKKIKTSLPASFYRVNEILKNVRAIGNIELSDDIYEKKMDNLDQFLLLMKNTNLVVQH